MFNFVRRVNIKHTYAIRIKYCLGKKLNVQSISDIFNEYSMCSCVRNKDSALWN
jgi:predicted methyltransferase